MNSLIEDYQTCLLNSERALSYLGDRRVSLEAIKTFGIGYFNANEFDLFYDRIMFPIRNAWGDLIAFQGRALYDWKQVEGQQKWRHDAGDWKPYNLGGLYENAEAIVSNKRVTLVEGWFDVVALWQCGIPALALLGSNLSEQQALLLRMYTEEVDLWLDPDKAGVRGTETAINTLSAVGINSTITFSNIDPADMYVQYGKEKVWKILNC